MKTNGNVILITGGASGIGLAIAKKFVSLGNKIVLVGRNKEKLKKAVSLLSNSDFIQCDVSLQEELEKLSITVQQKFPDINIIVNNAGVQYNYYLNKEQNPFTKINEEIAVNISGPVKLSILMLPYLSLKKEAAIINVSSALGFAPKENAAVYCATKAAVHNFSVTLRYQLEKSPVKVIELIPPLVNTEMTKGRGKDKINPVVVADALIRGLLKNKTEINVGKVKILRQIFRFAPSLAYKIMRSKTD